MTRTILAGLGIITFVLSACGDDGPGRAADIRPRLQTEAGEIVVSDVVCPPIGGYDGPVADQGIDASIDGAIAIDAGDFFFSPTCVVNPAGDTIAMTVTNSGGILHNVSVADQGVDVDVPPGQTIVVEIAVGDEPLAFICKYHRTAGMVGGLIPAATT
jgi:plastocyanin